MDCSLPGFSVHGILQARILEWVAFLPPGELPNPGIEPASLTSPALAGEFFTIGAEEGKKQITQTELTPSCTFNELWTTYLVTMEITYQ